jgi:hypothetical protein
MFVKEAYPVPIQILFVREIYPVPCGHVEMSNTEILVQENLDALETVSTVASE